MGLHDPRIRFGDPLALHGSISSFFGALERHRKIRRTPLGCLASFQNFPKLISADFAGSGRIFSPPLPSAGHPGWSKIGKKQVHRPSRGTSILIFSVFFFVEPAPTKKHE